MRKSSVYTQRKTGSQSNSIKPTLLALAIAQALAFQTAQAANIDVTSNLDDSTDCTLREAITTVNAGSDQLNGCAVTGDPLGTNDTVTFGPAVVGQTINTTQGELPITKDVSINPRGVNTTIDANQASTVMSVISNDAVDLSVTLNRLTITGGKTNSSRFFGGAGIYISNSFTQVYNEVSLTLANSTVSGNSGFGITVISSGYDDDAKVKLINSTISGNTGGINAHTSSVYLSNSTVSGNTESGGIFLSRAGATLVNTTVSGNTATGFSASGIEAYLSVADLTNSTVTGNTSDSGSGIHSAYGGFSLENSIIANNTAYGSNDDCASFEVYAGPDTISTTPCGGATVADPLLGPLADNGGPTQTHALLAGSPAIDNGTGRGATATDQRGVTAEGLRDSGAYEFTGVLNPLTIEKLINHRSRETYAQSAQLIAGTRYRAEYKVTNNSPDRIYDVQVFEGGQLVCNLYTLDPGESKQPYRCASNQNVLGSVNNIPATVTAKILGTNQELVDQTHAYYTGFRNTPGSLTVRHYVNNKNADTQAAAVDINGNQPEVTFRVKNTGSTELYRVKTYHDPASPTDSGWQQQCFIGTLTPGQVRYCTRTINVTHAGLNIAFGRAQGEDANISATGIVNTANPTYYNVLLP